MKKMHFGFFQGLLNKVYEFPVWTHYDERAFKCPSNVFVWFSRNRLGANRRLMTGRQQKPKACGKF